MCLINKSKEVTPINFDDLNRFAKNVKLVDEITMPKNKDIVSWRAYVEDGRREFCEHEIAILKRFIRRMTGVHKKLLFPDRFGRDRTTAIYLWCQYIEARQTPAQAAQRARSLDNYKATCAAASLYDARKKLNERLNADPAMIEHIRKRRKANEQSKNFDFSKQRVAKGQLRKERPMRPRPTGIRPPRYIPMKSGYQTPATRLHVADLMKVDDIPVSSRFIVNIATPKPAANLLRRDPNLGKHMVKRGRESPLRQSVSLSEFNDCQQDIHNREEHVNQEIEDLKQQIAAFERKNFAYRSRHKLPSEPQSRRSRRSQLDGQ